MPWTDETKAKAIELYQQAEPTPENSMDIVNEIAEQMGESPNGVRAILSKAGVYVKKEPAAGAKAGASKTTKAASTRVSKEDAQAQLVAAIEAAGKDVDSDIISKLTGKAAIYFAGLFA